MSEENYYRLLKKSYRNKEAVVTEIVNLEAILHLPKGTEHFVSDIHGEYDAFDYVLRNGSGSVKEKLSDCFADEEVDIADLATLIYYPQEKTKLEESKLTLVELKKWYADKIKQLIRVVNYSSRKYTRSKVRKALPERFRYIIEELLTESQDDIDKQAYIQAIIDKVIQLNQAAALICTLCELIQRFVVDHLHVVGDIYDRGPSPDLIMERLINYHSVDIQWGNHDMVWLAAKSGSPLALVNLLRICARYGNLNLIEDNYGVSLRPLIEYSRKYYQPINNFAPHLDGQTDISAGENDCLNCIQQATAILQFKLESQLIKRRPELLLQKRAMLEFIDYDKKTIALAGKKYPLVDFNAPTLNPKHPCQLTKEEQELLQKILHSFQNSERISRHLDFLMEKGSMYLCYNNNLLLHGCIPLHQNGDFKSLRIGDKHYAGKELLDFYEEQVRYSYSHPEIKDDFATDLMWYLWVGECSSLFGKKAMTTFERYYIADKRTHIEDKNAYYRLRDKKSICQEILRDFQLPVNGHIINGHTPIKAKKGESPIKAQGQMLVIDGGFSKSYQKETGIAGYTLLSNSYGLQLVAHQPFTSIKNSIEKNIDVLSTKRLIEKVDQRTTVSQTNIGKQLIRERNALQYLNENYNNY